MRTYDDEEVIIEHLQSLDKEEIIIFGGNDCKKIIKSILDDKKWQNWVNSSGKNQPPPDFYNDKEKYMMEIMRVDDHAYVNSKNKVVNDQLNLEGKAYKNFIKNVNLDGVDEKTVFFTNIFTDLPTDEDHNFSRYQANFKRVIEKHSKQTDNYKKNHNGYKLIFFVFDESSAYIECEKELNNGLGAYGRVHVNFADNYFLEIIKKCGADYFIWFAPYKYIESVPKISIPHCAVYRINDNIFKGNCFNYDITKIKSAEK